MFHYVLYQKSIRHCRWTLFSDARPESGVARVPCALGQEIFLRPPSTKLQSLKKNRCKASVEIAKVEHLLQLFCSFLRR